MWNDLNAQTLPLRPDWRLIAILTGGIPRRKFGNLKTSKLPEDQSFSKDSVKGNVLKYG